MEFSKTKKISQYFTEYEVFNSNTANSLELYNGTDDVTHLSNINETARNLDNIRVGIDEPILVTSWYRSPALNVAIGGALNSQHSKGEAVDIKLSGRNKNNRDLFDEIRKNHDFDQLILEFPDSYGVPKWNHVSFKRDGSNRNEILVAKKDVNGDTVYSVFTPESTPYKKESLKKKKLGIKIIGAIGFLTTLYFIIKN